MDVKNNDITHTSRGGWRFVSHIKRLSGEGGEVSQAYATWLERAEKGDRHGSFMVGKKCGQSVVYLVWFELSADAKEGSIWAFLSAFPDVGQQWKREG